MASSSRVESSVLSLPVKFHPPKTFPFQNKGLGQILGMSGHLKQNYVRMVRTPGYTMTLIVIQHSVTFV